MSPLYLISLYAFKQTKTDNIPEKGTYSSAFKARVGSMATLVHGTTANPCQPSFLSLSHWLVKYVGRPVIGYLIRGVSFHHSALLRIG